MDKEELRAALKRFMRENKITQVDLSTAMKLQQSVISEMVNGKRKAERLVDFLHENYGFNHSNDVVLAVDEETQEKKLYTENSNGIRFYEREDGQMLLEAPLAPFNALGSPDDVFAQLQDDRENGEVELFEVDGIHHGSYISFVVDGDSMDDGTYNSFRRGDKVLVRNLSRDLWLPKLHFNKWPYWVVVFGNCVRLKQIVAQDEKAGTITLHSLNPSPEYTDFTLNLDDIQYLYNVIVKKPKQIKYGNF